MPRTIETRASDPLQVTVPCQEHWVYMPRWVRGAAEYEEKVSSLTIALGQYMYEYCKGASLSTRSDLKSWRTMSYSSKSQ